MAVTALLAVPAALLAVPAALLAVPPPLAVPTTLPAARLAWGARRAAVALAGLAVGSLPWLIPSLLHPVYVDPASVAAFAARADTPFGSIGSLLMLGGAWNAQTVPKAYGGPWSALWLAVVIVAVAAYLLFAPAPPARRLRWPGLGRWRGRRGRAGDRGPRRDRGRP